MNAIAPPPALTPVCRFAPAGAKATYLCHCAKVSEEGVRALVEGGRAASVGEVMELTEAGTGCRACHCRIERVLSGLPATCGGRFDWCHQCGCVNAVCSCAAA